jgi:hypothetical protein
MMQPSPTILATFSCLLVIFSVCQMAAIRWLWDLVFTHGTSVGF